MPRVRKPSLVDVTLDHDRVFAEDMGLATPRTIGKRSVELAKEKVQGGSPPVLSGGWQDDEASSNLAAILHQQGIINNQTDQGFTDVITYHDVNPATVTASETIDVTQEVRRYNAATGAANIVVTLPAISDIPAGKIFTFRRDDDSGFKVTITAAGSDVIDNRATYELMGHNACISIMSTVVNGWILVSRTNGDARWFETVPSVGQLMTAGTIGANTAYLTRVTLDNPITIFSGTYGLGATAGAFNVDMGFYYSNGTTLTRLGSTGSTVLGSANSVTTRAFTALVQAYPGFDYYVGFACDSAVPTFYKFIGNAILTAWQNKTIAFTTSFPLPATLTIASGAVTGNQPWVAIDGV